MALNVPGVFMSALRDPSADYSKKWEACQSRKLAQAVAQPQVKVDIVHVDNMLLTDDQTVDVHGVVTLTSGTGGGSSVIGSIVGSGAVISAGSGAVVVSAGSGSNRLIRG